MNTKNNKLIAEFMAGGTVNTHHNRYHDSWDELMPVVGKISEGKYAGGITYDIQNTLIIANIDNVYKAIIEFIKWYNKKENNV